MDLLYPQLQHSCTSFFKYDRAKIRFHQKTLDIDRGCKQLSAFTRVLYKLVVFVLYWSAFYVTVTFAFTPLHFGGYFLHFLHYIYLTALVILQMKSLKTKYNQLINADILLQINHLHKLVKVSSNFISCCFTPSLYSNRDLCPHFLLNYLN